MVFCEDCKVGIKYGSVHNHKNSASHRKALGLQPIVHLKTIDCLHCNKEVKANTWRHHIKSLAHQLNENGVIEQQAKIKCECGTILSKRQLTKHLKSKKHNDYESQFCTIIFDDTVQLMSNEI